MTTDCGSNLWNLACCRSMLEVLSNDMTEMALA